MTTPSTDGPTGAHPVKPALHKRLLTDLAGLAPAYFGLVMATGIVAIGANQQNLDLLAQGLYVITVLAYVVLAVLLAGLVLAVGGPAWAVGLGLVAGFLVILLTFGLRGN